MLSYEVRTIRDVSHDRRFRGSDECTPVTGQLPIAYEKNK